MLHRLTLVVVLDIVERLCLQRSAPHGAFLEPLGSAAYQASLSSDMTCFIAIM